MSIVEFSSGSARRKVGFLGDIPAAAVLKFEARRYECVALVETAGGYIFVEQDKTRSLDDEALWEFDCLVLLQDKDVDNLSEALKTFAPLLLPRDVRIYILSPFNTDSNRGVRLQSRIIKAINKHEIPNSGLREGRENFMKWDVGLNQPTYGPFAHVIYMPPDDNWDLIIEIIRSNSASAAPKLPLSIDAKKSDGKDLGEEEICLLQRAFYNCVSIKLVALKNGLSETDTYRGYIRLQNPVGPSLPYVYFVKLGNRKNIATEYRKYELNVMDHVPYHLGPRLRRDRCALGHKLGVIVTDYVHTAEALRDCARDGRAGAAIGNLFSHTLRNWRDGAKPEDIDIGIHLKEIVKKDVPPHRIQTIESFDPTTKPKEINKLRSMLLRSKSMPTLMGVIHNDLHATNVLVRANDAIIIDFEKLEESGPLLHDVASLEAGLFADGFVGDKRTPSKLLRSIESLYTLDALNWKFPEFNSSGRSAWFFECVRLVRMHAREMQIPNRQYALVLAAALLKKSCNEFNFDELDKVDKTANLITREKTRAMAYVLAEKIILCLSNTDEMEAK